MMVKNMKDILKMINMMELEKKYIPTGKDMKEVLKKVNIMVKEYGIIKMGIDQKVFGIKDLEMENLKKF